MVEPILRLEAISKVYPGGTAALRDVSMLVRAGEVHGLLGANGAGKSTLIKVLSGAVRASGGRIIWRDQEVSWHRPADAVAAGVATIHQHIPLVPTLSVQENVFLARGGVRRRTAKNDTQFRELLRQVGYRIDPEAMVGDLPIGQRQMVSILAALAGGGEVLVMDEPTASLADEEREVVYGAIRRLTRQEGKAIIFVSHFLDEVLSLTDEVTVLRDGRTALTAATGTLDVARLTEAIVGDRGELVTKTAPLRGDRAETPILEIRQLRSPGKLQATDLRLERGEVLGIAGFLGSRRSELLHAIFGADRQARGDVLLHGKTLGRSPGEAVAMGVGLVPEDRNRQGYIPAFEIWRNTSLPRLVDFSWKHFLPTRSRETAFAADCIRRLGIKAQSAESLVTALSGGNAQKVVVGKWLGAATRLLLLDEPTAGIDIGAKAEILSLVRALAAQGCGIIIVSSDFEELIAASDRILVMQSGRIVAERMADKTDAHELVLLATSSVGAEAA